jgi:hypothetical protein
MLRLSITLVAMSILASCERSNRTVEIQPNDKKVLPDGSSSGTGDTIAGSTSLRLRVSGLPSSAAFAQLRISIDGVSQSKSVDLMGGSGTAVLSGLTSGDVDVSVTATVNQVDYSGSASISLMKGQTATASIAMSSSGGGGTTPSGPNGNSSGGGGGTTPIGPNGNSSGGGGGTIPIGPNGNNSGGGDTSIDIGIDIGGNTNVPNNNNNNNNNNNSNNNNSNNNNSNNNNSNNNNNNNNSNNNTIPPAQNVWDGKSFKGNNMFSIEPVD